MKPQGSPLVEPLRAALKAAPSRYSVSMATGIDQSALSRFLRGQDVRLSTAEKLARHFNLKLTGGKR